jgi:methylmalonyl-CoA/ethylmalonyl-CoA epimerase
MSTESETTVPAAGAASPLYRVPDQIAWVVEDLDAAVERMAQTLGAAPWIGWNYTADYVPERIFRVAAHIDLHPNLEVIQPISGSGPSVFTEFLEQHGPGVQHLGYFVEAYEPVAEYLKDLGYEEIMAGGKHGVDGDGWWGHFTRPEDPTGLGIEIVEPPARRRDPHFTLLADR